jgi:uncharacterized protein DUF955
MFRRGFKTWCEETALQLRKQLGISPQAPLDPYEFAQHLGVTLKTPHDFTKLAGTTRARLLGEHADSWSAFTITNGRKPMIVYNPAHSAARTASNLMHELAHIILGHRPAKMFLNASGIPLRSHDKDPGKRSRMACWMPLASEARASGDWKETDILHRSFRHLQHRHRKVCNSG